MKKACMAVLAVFMLTFALSSYVRAQSPQETLNQYVSDLRSNPNDSSLREKIIRLAREMKPAPAIPEEARRNYVMAKTLFKDAKNVQDYNDALTKFKSALALAPWWADAYLDLGLASEAAQQYDEAVDALKLYVVAYPDSEMGRKAQDEIYIIEAKKEKAAKESSPQAIAERQQKKAEELLKSLDGTRYVHSFQDSDSGQTNSCIIHGDEVDCGSIINWARNSSCIPSNMAVGVYLPTFRCHISNKKIQGDDLILEVDNSMNNFMYKSFTISGNGNTLISYFNGEGQEEFNRQ